MLKAILRMVLIMTVGPMAFAPGRTVHAQGAPDFFAGKQITIIVGSDTGGGYDTNARVIARHLGRFIAGNPAIVVRNMPGAGAIVAANHLYNVAPRDGTTIGMLQRGIMMAKIAGTQAQFDPVKFNWLANMSAETGLVVAWHTAPQMSADDLLRMEFVVGGSGPSGETETIPRLLNAMIGAKFRIVPGYPSSASILVAMERGEIQGVGDWEWPNIKTRRPDFLRDHKVRLLLQSGLERDPDLPDVPLALDYAKNDIDRRAMELFFAQKTISRPLLAPPGLPAERLAILREAFSRMGRDASYLEDASKSGLEVSPQSGDVVERVAKMVDSAPQEVTQRLSQAIAATH